MNVDRDGRVTVTGGQVWYKIVGASSPRIPLLVVHGGPGATHDYLEPLAGFSAERPVVFYDQLGAGNSDHPDDPSLWTVERFVAELAELRTALGLREVHLLGQSWGGALVVEYMLTQHPAGICSLVLSAPLLSTSRWVGDQRAYVAQLPVATREVIERNEAARSYESPEYQEAMMAYYRLHLARMDPWPDCINRTFEKLNAAIYQHMWGPSEFTVTGTLIDFERVDRLKEIAVPTLFTAGEHDEASPDTIRYFQGAMPGSEVAIFSGASHEHHVEQAADYLRLVGAFLRRFDRF